MRAGGCCPRDVQRDVRRDVHGVELRGFEPLTSSMPWKRATNCAIAPCGCGPRAEAPPSSTPLRGCEQGGPPDLIGHRSGCPNRPGTGFHLACRAPSASHLFFILVPVGRCRLPRNYWHYMCHYIGRCASADDARALTAAESWSSGVSWRRGRRNRAARGPKPDGSTGDASAAGRATGASSRR